MMENATKPMPAACTGVETILVLTRVRNRRRQRALKTQKGRGSRFAGAKDSGLTLAFRYICTLAFFVCCNYLPYRVIILVVASVSWFGIL